MQVQTRCKKIVFACILLLHLHLPWHPSGELALRAVINKCQANPNNL